MNLTDKYVDRNRKILEDALHGEAFSHIARINNLTSERIRQIVQEYSGFTSKDLRATEKKYKRTLNMEYKNLLDVLQQHYFDRLIEERGLDHALAWRCHDVYEIGKTYSLEDLEKLIAARRAGEGYYRCVKFAGIATDKRDVNRNLPQASIVLKRALCDVVLSHLEQVFHHGREKLTPYEKIQFAGLWNRGVSSDKIKETLHLVSSPSYYARKLGLKRRPSCITFSVNYSLLDTLIYDGKKSKEMVKLGFSRDTVRIRKKEVMFKEEK